jgi:Phage integrase, N-terminal SAM-like domain
MIPVTVFGQLRLLLCERRWRLTKLYTSDGPVRQIRNNLCSPKCPYEPADLAPAVPPPYDPKREPRPHIERDGGASAFDLLVRFEDEALAGQSAYTARAHQAALVRFAQWLELRSLLEATLFDIRGWLNSLAIGGSALSERGAVLRRFYDWLLSEGLIERNPAAHLAPTAI